MEPLLAAIKSGRAFNGAHRDAGKIVHIVEGPEWNGFWGTKALCGTQPGYRGNGWATTLQFPTCEKCIKKLEKNTSPTHRRK